MLSKTGLVVSLFALSKLAVAAPPACLLAAVNTQDDPGDLESLCGRSASEVQETIEELCDADTIDLALETYEDTCSGYGSDSSSESSMMTMSESMSSMMSSMMSSDAMMSSTIALTSTYYDEDCSCTTSSVISTVVAMSNYNGDSATGGMYSGSAGGIYSTPTESPGSIATDGVDVDAGDDSDDEDESTSTDDAPGAISTGAAARSDVGSFIAAVGAFAFAAVAL